MSRRAQLEGHVAAAPPPLPANAAFGLGPVHGCPWDPALSPGGPGVRRPGPRRSQGTSVSVGIPRTDVVGREGEKGFGFSARRAGGEPGRAPRLPAIGNHPGPVLRGWGLATKRNFQPLQGTQLSVWGCATAQSRRTLEGDEWPVAKIFGVWPPPPSPRGDQGREPLPANGFRVASP